MLCGVKFCGGCNPRYDRGQAFEQIRLHFAKYQKTDRAGESLRFDFAKEDVSYDSLLVIGGCPACCATIEQYTVTGEMVKMWAEDHLEEAIQKCEGWL